MTEDALAIANLKAVYCLAADTATTDRDAAKAMFDGLFTDDFVGDYGFGMLEGEHALVEFLIEAIAGGSEWMIHALGSPLIRVDGDTATGDWTIQVESRRRGAEGRMAVCGRYSDVFRKTSQGWRIARIAFQRQE